MYISLVRKINIEVEQYNVVSYINLTNNNIYINSLQ